MEFEGVVFKKLPVSKGVSARGEWQRQDVVFEVPSEFSRKICVTFFNKPTEADSLVEGQTYTVSVNVESREYNGKWYTDVRAWRVQPKQQEAAQQGAPAMPDMPPFGDKPSYGGGAGVGGGVGAGVAAPMADVDDLPF